jgi:sarcosine oxidase subunit beta
VIETDVLVVGGGIAGASTAFHLAPYRRVTLVERGEIAGEASGVNAGSISNLGWGDAPNLQSYLTAGSLEIFKALQLDLGHDIEWRQSWALRAIQTDAQYTFTRDRVLDLRARGYRAELLTVREARALEPAANPALLGFMYSPLAAQADPRKATRAFAAAAERQGARILTGCEVTAIRDGGGAGYRVTTTRDDIVAGTVVIAAGAWCAQLGAMLGLHIPIVPVRGQMWASAALPPRIFHTISSSESMLDWSRERGRGEEPPELTHRKDARVTRHLYGRQTRSGEVTFGGDRQLAGYTTVPEAAGIAVNHAHASEVIPLVRELPITRTWAGLMPFSLDGAPIIGRIAARENLFVVTGLASSGFGRGPMAGRLLAEYVHTGHRPHVLAEADPARCVRVIEPTPR